MIGYPFDGAELLANKRAIRKKLLEQPALLEKRIAILSGTTIGAIKPILELFLLDFGIRPVFFEGDYARYYEEVVFGDEKLKEFAPDILFFHTGLHNLTLPKAGCSEADAEALLEREKKRFETLWTAAQAFACPVIQNNFEYPLYRIMGAREAYDPSGKLRFVRAMNSFCADWAASHKNFYLNDINWLSSVYGLDRWSDPSYYHSYKYQQSPDAIPTLAHAVACIIKSLFGKNQKALMLDLDNTLWGGVIGDDGVEGIKLGTESPEGIAYLEMQSYAKELPGIGVVLGVCSKNEDKAARGGFEHPSAVLKPDDFAVFRANWEDKASNLKAAAAQLNIGTDALVFADDNPAEREIVRTGVSGIRVPELTVPERYVQTIANAGYFEITTFSDDDRKRAEMYKQNAQREAELESFADYGGYLDSLEMKGYFEPFTEARMERITQLANKTNQFNLTTRRYTAEEMALRASDPRFITLSGRLEDKFGDNGLVSELIGEVKGEVAEIELWIMSCRVFKRELEHTMFDRFVRRCKERGVKTIRGFYYPTAKNVIVADFLGTMGFERISLDDAGNSVWEYEIPETYSDKNTHIEVHE